jgi:glutathionyl-hydroquinone reductase
MDYINHYKISNTVVNHRGKTVITSLNSKLDEFINSLRFKEIEVGYIPAGYEHRPDLISNLFYDTVTYDWMILMFNNIKDPFQELNVGDRILLPKL